MNQNLPVIFWLLLCVASCKEAKKVPNSFEEKTNTTQEITVSHDTLSTSPNNQTVDSSTIRPKLSDTKNLNDNKSKKSKNEKTPQNNEKPQNPPAIIKIPKDVTIHKEKPAKKPDIIQIPADVPKNEDKPQRPPVINKIPKDIPLSGKEHDEVKVLEDHKLFNSVLSKHVSSAGFVDYPAIAKDDDFENYLSILSKNPPLDSWSKDERIAFWVNAYNAFTIKRIIDTKPRSIMDLDGGKTWDVKWIQIGNKKFSLNNIENDILRPLSKDGQIHFAINCAAKSCPPLWNRAWSASNLKSSLLARTKAFIADSNFNTLSSDKVKISKIFDWYKADFGDIISYINAYVSKKINPNAKIEFQEYDWSLNGRI